jgi:tetratricopeptide (TPR) repeat protein
MSLISDLLSKVKRQDPRRDIPPLLKEAVMHTTADRKARSRFMIPLAIAAFAAAAGVGAIFLMDFFQEPAPVSRTPMKTTEVSPPAAPATSSIVQQPEAVVAAAVPKVDEKRSMQAAEQKLQKIETAPPVVRKKTTPRGPVKTSVAAGLVENRDEARQVKTFSKGKPDQAKKTEGISRWDRDLYLYAARTYEMQKNYQGAISNYRKLLALDPRNYIIMNNLSSALIRAGAYEEAIGYAQRALQNRRDYLFPHINLGIAYSQLGKYAEGEGYLRQALSTDPTNRLALLNLGLLQEKRNALDSAREVFARLSDAGDTQGYLGLARIAEKQGQTADAIQLYQTALSMESRESPLWAIANERLWQLSK